jgi:hypothetical protein
MNKVFAVTLVAAAVGFSSIAAQAMPIGSNQTHDSLVVQVAGGCGLGFHRGLYGRCYPNAPVVVAPTVVAPVVGPCGGRGQHRVCNRYGRCWMACNY